MLDHQGIDAVEAATTFGNNLDCTTSFFIAENIRSDVEFAKVWHNSDLPRIVGRFAELALHQYKHLAKNPAKTEAKIRM